MDISDKIKTLREKKGLSKNKLGKLAGVSQSYVSEIEAGKKKPTLEILERICNALEITIVELLSDPNSDLPPDIAALIESAKHLTLEQRKALQRFIDTLKANN